jgi:two-component system response regulator HydG
LRQRPGDIPLLALHFVEMFNREFKKNVTGLSPEARDLVLRYAWPGNVRELRNAIERAMLLATGAQIQPSDLRITATSEPSPVQLPADGLDLEAVEHSLIRQALERTGANQSAAAKLLRCTRDKIRYFIKTQRVEA